MNISVVIPVYNGERYLAEAITTALRQTRPPAEIIVADDGSTDRSEEVARSFSPPVRYIQIEHKGVGAARNAGVAVAAGDHVAFLDADDLWPPDKLEVQAQRMSSEPEIDMVFGMMKEFVSPELSAHLFNPRPFRSGPLKGVVAGAMLARREVFERTGGFKESLAGGAFIDWYARDNSRRKRKKHPGVSPMIGPRPRTSFVLRERSAG
jgi:glycosyltransferase involved in cell wall biosynthesis